MFQSPSWIYSDITVESRCPGKFLESSARIGRIKYPSIIGWLYSANQKSYCGQGSWLGNWNIFCEDGRRRKRQPKIPMPLQVSHKTVWNKKWKLGRFRSWRNSWRSQLLLLTFQNFLFWLWCRRPEICWGLCCFKVYLSVSFPGKKIIRKPGNAEKSSMDLSTFQRGACHSITKIHGKDLWDGKNLQQFSWWIYFTAEACHLKVLPNVHVNIPRGSNWCSKEICSNPDIHSNLLPELPTESKPGNKNLTGWTKHKRKGMLSQFCWKLCL